MCESIALYVVCAWPVLPLPCELTLMLRGRSACRVKQMFDADLETLMVLFDDLVLMLIFLVLFGLVRC